MSQSEVHTSPSVECMSVRWSQSTTPVSGSDVGDRKTSSSPELESESVQHSSSSSSDTQRHRHKGEGNVILHSASSRTSLTRQDIDHTVLPANNTISAFTRKHSPGSANTHICIANAWVQLTTHLSSPRGWMAELADIQWTVYPRRSPVNCTSWRRAGKFDSHGPTF